MAFSRKSLYFFGFALAICSNSFAWSLADKDGPKVAGKQEKTFIILVHGTFASNSSWHSHKGPFFLELKKYCQNAKMDFAIESHLWSGALSSNGRLQGAIGLAKRIMEIKQGCPDGKIICIGHSHGGNVILMASQMLYMTKSIGQMGDIEQSRSMVWSLIAQDLFCVQDEFEGGHRSIETDSDPMIETIKTVNQIEVAAQMIKEFLTRGGPISKEVCKIDQAYLLATPINTEIYPPCVQSIGSIYSVYSLMDMVQIYSNVYKRRFIDCGLLTRFSPVKIFEFKVQLYDNEKDQTPSFPGHLEMNDAWVGAGILSLPYATTLTTIVAQPEEKSQFMVKFYKDCVTAPKVFVL